MTIPDNEQKCILLGLINVFDFSLALFVSAFD